MRTSLKSRDKAEVDRARYNWDAWLATGESTRGNESVLNALGFGNCWKYCRTRFACERTCGFENVTIGKWRRDDHVETAERRPSYIPTLFCRAIDIEIGNEYCLTLSQLYLFTRSVQGLFPCVFQEFFNFFRFLLSISAVCMKDILCLKLIKSDFVNNKIYYTFFFGNKLFFNLSNIYGNIWLFF